MQTKIKKIIIKKNNQIFQIIEVNILKKSNVMK